MNKLLPLSIAQQAHESGPLNPNSDEMAMDEDEEDDTDVDVMNGPQDVMNDGELEVGENDEEDGSGDDGDEGEDSDNYDYEENVMEGDEDGDRDGYNEDDEGRGGGCHTRNLHAAVTTTRWTVMAMFQCFIQVLFSS